ncbi:MAG: inositol monophosphatase [Nitrospinae bacterium]|nr:inositol monophosphatase [Nitrospinota bacterium]MBF0635316.1 inositol monophosphatase [Nitrospinota bacterium]
MSVDIDLDEAVTVAQNAALRAGAIQAERLHTDFKVERKGEIDLVTEVDLACEEAIINVIREAYPAHIVLAEEKGRQGDGDSPYLWVIDPLDGTTNYSHGFPFYCASVALTHRGVVLAGAVYDPTRDEMFHAIRGGGAFLNGERISVSRIGNMISALLATGFPYSIKTTDRNNLKEFAAFAMSAQAIRRPGAAALDLCYVACGRVEGFWEFHLKPWDMAGGALLVMEAGGKVTQSDGSPLDLYKSDIVASNGLLHEAMLTTLRNA